MAKDTKQRILDEALIMERDRHPEREPEVIDRIRMFAVRSIEACKE